MKNVNVLICGFLLIFNLAKAQQTQQLPKVNAAILEYIKTTIGKKVDRGECWDLANQALTHAGAFWTFPSHFGKEVNPAKYTIYPGDIIQFTNVRMKNSKNETWTFPKHTAIVYEVISTGVYKVAEQNVNGKRKVQIDDLNCEDKVSGKMIFYRPVEK